MHSANLQPVISDHVVATMSDGAQILLRRLGNPQGPRLVLSHGNGLAIDGYMPFWDLLQDYELVLFDFRNHGCNPRHGAANHCWEQFAIDLEYVCNAIDSHFGRRPAVGVFHSLAGITALIHAQRRRWRWNALVLFEPPLYPWDGHPLQQAGRDYQMKMAAWSASRQERFASPAELAEMFRGSWSLRRWRPEAYELMARAILQYDEARGDWALTCRPALESRIYATNVDTSIWPLIADIPGPIKMICSDPDAPDRNVNNLINIDVAREQGLECDAIGDTGHVLQVERPEACVASMESFLGRVGFI